MRNTILTLSVAMIVSLSMTSDADAAGRRSIFARLSSPFGTLQSSRFTATPFGLPSYAAAADNPFAAEASAPVVAQPLIAVEGVDQTPAAVETVESFSDESSVFTPLSSTSGRTPYRPRVRSPFRPPPRPSF